MGTYFCLSAHMELFDILVYKSITCALGRIQKILKGIIVNEI